MAAAGKRQWRWEPSNHPNPGMGLRRARSDNGWSLSNILNVLYRGRHQRLERVHLDGSVNIHSISEEAVESYQSEAGKTSRGLCGRSYRRSFQRCMYANKWGPLKSFSPNKSTYIRSIDPLQVHLPYGPGIDSLYWPF